jgi:hypothetical protein
VLTQQSCHRVAPVAGRSTRYVTKFLGPPLPHLQYLFKGSACLGLNAMFVSSMPAIAKLASLRSSLWASIPWHYSCLIAFRSREILTWASRRLYLHFTSLFSHTLRGLITRIPFRQPHHEALQFCSLRRLTSYLSAINKPNSSLWTAIRPDMFW